MSLIPRNRLFDLDNIFEPSLFSHTWPQFGPQHNKLENFSPRVNIEEKERTYEITAELPGVNKKDIHVDLKNGVLALHAEISSENKTEDKGKFIRRERHYGSFYRQFDVGPQVQESDITAEFKDGILTIVAPKAVEQNVDVQKINIR